jgi:hypothetical protein
MDTARVRTHPFMRDLTRIHDNAEELVRFYREESENMFPEEYTMVLENIQFFENIYQQIMGEIDRGVATEETLNEYQRHYGSRLEILNNAYRIFSSRGFETGDTSIMRSYSDSSAESMPSATWSDSGTMGLESRSISRSNSGMTDDAYSERKLPGGRMQKRRGSSKKSAKRLLRNARKRGTLSKPKRSRRLRRIFRRQTHKNTRAK